MRLVQLIGLSFTVQLASNLGCTTITPPRYREVNIPNDIESFVEPSLDVDYLSFTEVERDAFRENFNRLIRDSNDEQKTYHLLKMASQILYFRAMMIDAMEGVISNLEILIKSNQKVSATFGEKSTGPDLNELSVLKEREMKLKSYYAALARVYNQKMASMNFKFAETSGLPSHEMEVLPQMFPIR